MLGYVDKEHLLFVPYNVPSEGHNCKVQEFKTTCGNGFDVFSDSLRKDLYQDRI
ncbi:hypothetical protein OROHE_006935 [Orobanche hederae]